MAHHGTTTVPLHEDRILADVLFQFVEVYGEDASIRRAREISLLPLVEWKGRQLRTLRCHGVRGKGPHDCNLPESALWNLISLGNYCCVYHAGDQLANPLPTSPRWGPVLGSAPQ